jgi:hypothetical protein
MIPREDWYPRLVNWKHWEIPKPGREAMMGFLIVVLVSLFLHSTVLLICWLFRR